MATPTGFLNTNSQRAYPLVSRPIMLTRESDDSEVELPVSTIVDFGNMMGPEMAYDPSTDRVYLASISREGDTFTFTISQTVVDSEDLTLVFARELTDPEFSVEYASSLTALCAGAPAWEGFLVTGALTALAAVLPDGETLLGDEDAYFEPALTQACYQRAVRSINIANMDRIVARDPDICLENSSSSGLPPPEYEERVIREVARCLDGAVKLRPGYNCQILADTTANSLTLSAVVGGGAGEPCEEVQSHPEETIPADSPFYSGGPTCAEIILALNGITGPHIDLHVGPGMTLQRIDDHSFNLVIDSNDLRLKFLP